jgi:hypothetical protein
MKSLGLNVKIVILEKVIYLTREEELISYELLDESELDLLKHLKGTNYSRIMK